MSQFWDVSGWLTASLISFRVTIGVKRGCSLSSTLFGIYIDELESFLHDHIKDGDGCLLHQELISLLLFVDDLILLASTPEGL